MTRCTIQSGEVAKRLCSGLQSRLDGFDSRPRLQISKKPILRNRFFYISMTKHANNDLPPSRRHILPACGDGGRTWAVIHLLNTTGKLDKVDHGLQLNVLAQLQQLPAVGRVPQSVSPTALKRRVDPWRCKPAWHVAEWENYGTATTAKYHAEQTGRGQRRSATPPGRSSPVAAAISKCLTHRSRFP